MFSQNISILSVFISSLFACKSSVDKCIVIYSIAVKAIQNNPFNLLQVLCQAFLCGLAQWSTFMYSALQSLSVSFENVECSSVQISVARCSDCPVWYFPVQSRVVQCSAVWWSQAQPKTVQSSEVQCRPVQSSEVLSGSVQSSPVQSTPLTCGPVHSVKSAPVQSNSNSFPSS